MRNHEHGQRNCFVATHSHTHTHKKKKKKKKKKRNEDRSKTCLPSATVLRLISFSYVRPGRNFVKNTEEFEGTSYMAFQMQLYMFLLFLPGLALHFRLAEFNLRVLLMKRLQETM